MHLNNRSRSTILDEGVFLKTSDKINL